MDRPSRNKKPVNYFDDKNLDDDEDFACVKAPPSKKARVSEREPEREKATKPTSKNASQETGAQPRHRKDRSSLDDKLYERDLEAALTLSMLQTQEAIEELSPNDKGEKNQALSKSEAVLPSPLLSNCSVDIGMLGLDKITGERGSNSAPSRPRQAVSRAAECQRRVQEEQRDGGKDEDYQPTCTPDAGSDSDSDFSGEDESDDEEFTVKKADRKKPKKTEKPKKKNMAGPPVLKKEKKTSKSPKSRIETTAPTLSRIPSAGVPVSITKKQSSSPPVLKPAVPLSPAGGRLPKWTPPAQIGRSPSASEGAQVKSPGQGLRLGLSRLARVKPLHPAAVGH